MKSNKITLKEVCNILMLLGWAIGNLVVFSSVIYLSYVVVNNNQVNFDSIAISLVMLIWVFGQLNLAEKKNV